MGGNGGGGECCMCGDQGLSSELFTCKSCGFRSQHKYCSNQYPRAESYNNCNWCLTQIKDGQKGEEITKSSQNSSHKTTTADHHEIKTMKKTRRDVNPGDRSTATHHHNQIKKQNKPAVAAAADRSAPPAADRSAPPASAARKRVTSDGGGILIKRSRSEEISHNGGMMKKPVFRNKVRRYKLLDEVSS